MTLVSDIILDAYRESNINAIGVSPTAAQSDEALRLLNRLILAATTEQLQPVVLGKNNTQQPKGFPLYDTDPYPNWTVPANSRLLFNLTGPKTIYLNPIPTDGERFAVVDTSNNFATNSVTVIGNGRTIDGATQTILNTNGFSQEWLYRDDLGTWTKISPLVATDVFPYPPEFDDLFSVMLAIRLNPRNGAPIDTQSQLILAKTKKTFAARYRQARSVPSELGLLKTSIRKYRTNYNDSTQLFNIGYPGGSLFPWSF